MFSGYYVRNAAEEEHLRDKEKTKNTVKNN